MDKTPKLQRLRGTDIHRLSVFKIVVEVGGLSAAADFLDVDLSTVSRHVKDLELRLGFELCHRGPSGFSLTSKGRTAYEVACLLSDTLQTCDERLEGLRDGLSGTLRIGLVSHLLSTPELHFPEFLRLMRKNAPQLVIDCKILSTSEIMRQIESRQLHLGILGANELPENLEFTPLFREPAGLYCARGHPLFTHERMAFDRDLLEGQAYVARTHGSPTDVRAQMLGLVAETASNDVDVILSLVLSGIYLGFLPVHAVAALKDSTAFRRLPLEGAECAVPFYACTRKNARGSRRTDLSLRLLNDLIFGKRCD